MVSAYPQYFVSVFTCLLLTGCAFGRATRLVPVPHSIKCDENTRFYVTAINVSGWGVPYYIVPLGYSQWDNSTKNLVISLHFFTGGAIQKISPNAVQTISPNIVTITNLKTGERLRPRSVRLTTNDSHINSRSLAYEADFDVAPATLELFELSISEDVFGCRIPPITFTREEGSYHERVLGP